MPGKHPFEANTDGDCAHCPLPVGHPIHVGTPALVVTEPAHEVRLEPDSLPYAGTSGHSGSDTSRERAAERDREGVTGRMQRKMIAYLRAAGTGGLTVAEARQVWPEEHHGSLSGALSNLHKDGRIERLTARRGRCEVYVLPEYVGGRETVAQGRRSTSRLTADDTTLLAEAEGLRDMWDQQGRNTRILTGLIDLVTRLNGGTDD